MDAIPKGQLENNDPLIPILFDRLCGGYEAVRERSESGFVVRSYSIAGIRLRAEIPDERLADKILRAFEPLRIDSAGEPDLIWKVFEAPCDLARDEFPKPIYPPGIDGSIFAGRDHGLVAERQLFCDSVFAPDLRTIFTVCWSSQEMTLYSLAKPLLRFFYLILYAREELVTHGALIGRDSRGILVTGRGGTGKTTTSAVALLRGLDFVADDYVSIAKGPNGYLGKMLFASLMLHEKHIRRFSALAEIALFPSNPLESKALVYPSTHFAKQMSRSMGIVAVAVPALRDSPDSRLVPIAKVEALRALAPSSVYSSPWRETSRFDFYHEMLKRVPCFRLELGQDLERITDPIAYYLC